jgi:hypothetical protein
LKEGYCPPFFVLLRLNDSILSVMKKIALLSFLVSTTLLMNFETKAQSNWEAGIRFGDGVDLDFTIPFKAPRIHAAAYFNSGPAGADFGAGGYFDWLFALNGSPAGLKFYPGVGPELYFGSNFDFAVAGDFGVEYSFDFPLTIGLDWRPRVVFTNNNGLEGGNWGFIARFRFGEGVAFRRVN